MGKRLYVGNLAYSTMDQQLQDAFGEYGDLVSAQVVIDRATGQSRGFGFVEYEQAQDADRALESLNGTTLDGRAITVNEARERRPTTGGPPRRTGGDDGGGSRPPRRSDDGGPRGGGAARRR
jgi:RNA recognition motif-containing protein